MKKIDLKDIDCCWGYLEPNEIAVLRLAIKCHNEAINKNKDSFVLPYSSVTILTKVSVNTIKKIIKKFVSKHILIENKRTGKASTYSFDEVSYNYLIDIGSDAKTKIKGEEVDLYDIMKKLLCQI